MIDLKNLIVQNKDFIAFRLPQTDEIQLWIGEAKKFENQLLSNSFIIQSFDNSEKWFFQKDLCEIKYEKANDDFFEWNENFSKPCENDKQQHITLVEKGIQTIKHNHLHKVVLARKEKMDIDLYLLNVYFNKLIFNHNNAMVYCFNLNKIGTWIGATPELLLSQNGNKLHTMALAGTKKNESADVDEWGKKEIDEQKIVTTFIVDQFKKYTSNITISKPITHNAGKISHIKTEISADDFPIEKLTNLIDDLHPTPALAGFPKNEAIAFIQQNEVFNRKFYGGFLGFFRLDNQPYSQLYVNLRCMEIKDNQGFIYVGGGINKDSNAELEWEETINKSKTIKDIL